jgi:hypothetical protein
MYDNFINSWRFQVYWYLDHITFGI